jgi:hypothetical protein
MRRSEWDFESRIDDNEHDAALPESSEVLADRFGIRTALLVLCIALFIAAIWVTSRPSFEKCSALENVTERNACYDGLRNELLKPQQKAPMPPKAKIIPLRLLAETLHLTPPSTVMRGEAGENLSRMSALGQKRTSD